MSEDLKEVVGNVVGGNLDKFLDDYVPYEKLLNIAEIEGFIDLGSVEHILEEFPKYEDGAGHHFVFVIVGVKYKVPVIVMNLLNSLKKQKGLGRLVSFKVLREGTGLATKYQVIPNFVKD